MKEFTYTIEDELGIHARPAGLLSKLAKSFPDTLVTVTKGDKTVKASQLMKLMNMGIKRGGSGVGTMMRSETPLQYGEFYYELETFPGYAAGVATRDRTPPGKLRRYSLDEML